MRDGDESTTRFVFAKVDDNKKVDRFYRAKLEAFTGWKRDAWLDGDWDIFAGQYFESIQLRSACYRRPNHAASS
jgi:hypothetical protein